MWNAVVFPLVRLYGFFFPGWESQLLETGFLAIFLCPVWTLSQVPCRCPPSLISIWTFRWLIVRIMLGAVRNIVYRYLQDFGIMCRELIIIRHFHHLFCK